MFFVAVPGRIIRILASINIELLNLKQTFVRHVSHEIRSPKLVNLSGAWAKILAEKKALRLVIQDDPLVPQRLEVIPEGELLRVSYAI